VGVGRIVAVGDGVGVGLAGGVGVGVGVPPPPWPGAWISTVIEANGDVRPCFFHEEFGNIHEQELSEILNGPKAVRFRESLDVATNPVCQRCVCSLFLPNGNLPGQQAILHGINNANLSSGSAAFLSGPSAGLNVTLHDQNGSLPR
jgi:hypothetical protein